MTVSVANTAAMREVLGADAAGMSDEDLIALHYQTDDFAAGIVRAFASGARAPAGFVSTLEAAAIADEQDSRTCQP